METKFLTIKEVAEILKVNPETVRKKLRNGHIPGFKLGKDWRVSEKALNEFITKKHILYNKEKDGLIV